MSKAKCPICSCEEFYVKDPEDEYETYEFRFEDGMVCFESETEENKIDHIGDDTETHCNRCSWHDRLEKLKK
ncbi:MAG: hypothetical protein R6U27_12715 [Desulfobacterales bacterium]